MRKLILFIAVLAAFSFVYASDNEREGCLGADLGFSLGHGMYGSEIQFGHHNDQGERTFVDGYGGNIGIHYEPPVANNLNVVVTGRYNFLYDNVKYAGIDGTWMYHVPQIGGGIKYLMDVYNVIPFFGVGATFNLNAWSYDYNSPSMTAPQKDSGVSFMVGAYADLGVDFYVNDNVSLGLDMRYDYIFSRKLPNLFTMNFRVNFLTIN